jgi:hypothetical protein
MAELKHLLNCNYCGASYTLRYTATDATGKPEFCCFCGESFDSISRQELDDEELDDSFEDDSDDQEYDD